MVVFVLTIFSLKKHQIMSFDCRKNDQMFREFHLKIIIRFNCFIFYWELNESSAEKNLQIKTVVPRRHLKMKIGNIFLKKCPIFVQKLQNLILRKIWAWNLFCVKWHLFSHIKTLSQKKNWKTMSYFSVYLLPSPWW